MHNDTPLGAAMHLRELDRNASPKLDRSRARRQDAAPIIAVWAVMISLLRRLGVIGIPGQVASQG